MGVAEEMGGAGVNFGGVEVEVEVEGGGSGGGTVVVVSIGLNLPDFRFPPVLSIQQLRPASARTP